jgi:hypothetical protein
VRLHPLPSRLQDAATRHLAAELTATEMLFPNTDLRLVYTRIGPPGSFGSGSSNSGHQTGIPNSL